MLAELDEAGNQAKTYTLSNEYAGHVSELNNSLTSVNNPASVSLLSGDRKPQIHF